MEPMLACRILFQLQLQVQFQLGGKAVPIAVGAIGAGNGATLGLAGPPFAPARARRASRLHRHRLRWSIAPDPLVNLLVLDQVRLLPERFRADLAPERFLALAGARGGRGGGGGGVGIVAEPQLGTAQAVRFAERRSDRAEPEVRVPVLMVMVSGLLQVPAVEYEIVGGGRDDRPGWTSGGGDELAAVGRRAGRFQLDRRSVLQPVLEQRHPCVSRLCRVELVPVDVWTGEFGRISSLSESCCVTISLPPSGTPLQVPSIHASRSIQESRVSLPSSFSTLLLGTVVSAIADPMIAAMSSIELMSYSDSSFVSTNIRAPDTESAPFMTQLSAGALEPSENSFTSARLHVCEPPLSALAPSGLSTESGRQVDVEDTMLLSLPVEPTLLPVPGAPPVPFVVPLLPPRWPFVPLVAAFAYVFCVWPVLKEVKEGSGFTSPLPRPPPPMCPFWWPWPWPCPFAPLLVMEAAELSSRFSSTSIELFCVSPSLGSESSSASSSSL
uniref:Uncharacterized protein n=1 Tax=Anopheles merus TaxID=30066 RepID=A0A182UXJ5_ANOME